MTCPLPELRVDVSYDDCFLMNRLRHILSAVASMLLPAFSGVARGDAELDAAIAGAWELAETKTTATINYLKAAYPTNHLVKYPTETAANGQWNTADANTLKGWVSGFYPGTLWLLYQRTGDPQWLQYAKDWTAGIEAVKNNPLDHDLGFRFMCSFHNGYRLSNDVTDPAGAYRDAARNNLTTAAGTLDTLFNKGGIPVGAIKCLDGWVEPYPVIVDTMVNITLLFAAWDLSGRPASGPARNWYQHAVAHANTTIAQNLRTSASSDPFSRHDGSTYHCVNHNDGTGGRPADGAVFLKRTIQGFSNETTWSRGQAWALYGFTETYRHTRDDPSVNPLNFLNAARNLADYFIAHLPNNHTADPYNHVVGDFIPPSDFDAALGEPAGPWSNGRAGTLSYTLRDSSAAAIAASGLLRLCLLDTDPARKSTCLLAAENIIRSLLTFTGSDASLDYLGRDSQHMGILIGGSKWWGGTQGSLIYGDYYLLEALTRYEAIRDSNNAVTASFPPTSHAGSENVGTLTVAAQLSGPSTLTVTVPFTVGGTASSPADYTITQGPIVIPAGMTTGEITISVINDDVDEPDETVVITMGTPTHAGLGAITTHTVAIADDDAPLSAFDWWLRQYFVGAQLSDPTMIGDNADPDGDTIPNLVESALDLNPRVADVQSDALPRLQSVTGGDGSTLEFVYRRRLDMPDLQYGVETSTNLIHWTSVPDEPVDFQAQAETRRALLDAGGTARFARLKIVRGN
jgi:unsaturated chondroitin disaccharide hydrolase